MIIFTYTHTHINQTSKAVAKHQLQSNNSILYINLYKSYIQINKQRSYRAYPNKEISAGQSNSS